MLVPRPSFTGRTRRRRGVSNMPGRGWWEGADSRCIAENHRVGETRCSAESRVDPGPFEVSIPSFAEVQTRAIGQILLDSGTVRLARQGRSRQNAECDLADASDPFRAFFPAFLRELQPNVRAISFLARGR